MEGGFHSHVEKTAAMTNGAGAGTGLYFGHMKSEITIRLKRRGQMAQEIECDHQGMESGARKGEGANAELCSRKRSEKKEGKSIEHSL